MRAPPRKAVLGTVVGLVAAAIAAVILFEPRRQPPSMAGMVRQTEIRLAPEITGRLASIAVQAGQKVRKGELLATLDNPELTAALGEAKAAFASAQAERARIYSGVRAEEVAILAQSIQTAEASLLLARQENDRATALAARDYASRQQLDERTAALAKSEADLALKQAQHAAASAGPTAEERALADARMALAAATVAELQARLDKTHLVAPVDGTVGVLVAQPGEILPVGKPVLTLDSGEIWFSFSLREDALGRLKIGSEVRLSVDGGRLITAKVTELRPLGEFATWRAARAVGDHDLNSFRLRLDPKQPVEGLEPGMTVWLEPGVWLAEPS